MSTIHPFLALSTAACLAVSVTACSILGVGASPANEDVAGSDTNGATNDCKAAVATINGVLTEAQQGAPQLVQDLLTGNSIDPNAIVDPVLRSLDAAGSGATDPAVLAAIDEARVEWDTLATDVQALGTPDVSGIDLGDLGTLGELGTLQAYGEALSTVVSNRLPALQTTGAKLQAACATKR